MSKYLKLWPVLIWLAQAFFHSDLVVIPYLQSRGLSPKTIFFIVIPLVTIQIVYQIWFWGWVSTSFSQLHFSEKRHLINKIRKWFLGQEQKSMSPNKSIVRRLIEWGGYGAVFILAAIPVWGVRFSLVISCGTAKWRNGSYALILGNIGRVSLVIIGWTVVFHFFRHYL